MKKIIVKNLLGGLGIILVTNIVLYFGLCTTEIFYSVEALNFFNWDSERKEIFAVFSFMIFALIGSGTFEVISSDIKKLKKSTK